MLEIPAWGHVKAVEWNEQHRRDGEGQTGHRRSQCSRPADAVAAGTVLGLQPSHSSRGRKGHKPHSDLSGDGQRRGTPGWEPWTRGRPYQPGGKEKTREPPWTAHRAGSHWFQRGGAGSFTDRHIAPQGWVPEIQQPRYRGDAHHLGEYRALS